MWKLKFSHLFGGYGYYVFLASIFTMLFGMMCSVGSSSAFDMFFGMIIGIIAPGIVVYLFQNFMPDVLEKRNSAPAPDWRDLEPYEYEELLAQQVKKSPAMKYFLYAQIPLIIITCFIAASNGPMAFLIMEGIALTVCLSHYIITALTAGKWENVDATAKVAEIPIDDTYTVTIRYKHGVEYKPYYIYYLNSGRYVADPDQLYSGSTVKIVRWGGSVIYLRGGK